MRIARSVFYLAAALSILLVFGCAGSKKGDPSVILRSQRVQATMTDIVGALEKYHEDKGFFPKGMASLRDAHYLSIMPDLEREWVFTYYTDGDQVMMVEAVSTALMPDKAGRKIVYRVPEQVWEGYGITEFPR
jgi:hypothetical protein